MSEETHDEGKGGDGCLFCKIMAGEIPSNKVYEDADTFAFLDINPRNPGHTLVIPKKHYATIFDMPEKEVGKLFESAKLVAHAVRKATNADGLSMVQSNGHAAGQVVVHVHTHLIPRFSSEGPVSLEGVLAVKKMPQESINKIASSIKEGIGPGKKTDEPKFDF